MQPDIILGEIYSHPINTQIYWYSSALVRLISQRLIGSIMTLTPVPIRGKRKRNRTTPLNRPPVALRHHEEHQEELPLKHRKTKHSLLTILAMRQTRYATLESLPMEVLESIFLYSSNISLPRASPILGAKLSGKITRLRIFMWAFHDTWDQWFGIPTNEEVFYGPRVQSVLSWSQVADGDPALQV